MASSLQPEQAAPRLFISYSHDSREHEDQVRALADRLRQDGIDAVIDQYDTAPPAGWPMWMEREIQKADFVALVCTETYLKRVEGREEPGKGRGVLWEATLIYNLLYLEDSPKQRFIPILLEGRTTASIPLPIRTTTHHQVQTDEGYEDFYRHLTNQPRHEKPALGKLKSLPPIPPQSYPASLETRIEKKAPTTLDQRNRLQMLKRVRLDWIDGVLKQSLYNVARIELGLQTKSDAVEQPLKAIVQTPDQPPTVIPTGTKISQVFEDHGNALLILGAPGTGKTTLLLELAEQLLDRAEQDASHPIPVVFNLSSWAVRRLPLSPWLVNELNERSDVPKRLAQRWVETEQIIPLLDGLDEVAADHRESCVQAINDFRRDHGLLSVAVCSRIADYEALGTKLRLRSAAVVQPLTRAEIENYLNRFGEPLQALRAAIENNASLWELLETPLMLWVAMLAYRERPVEFSPAGTLEQQNTRLFAKFVSAMFSRRSAETRYTSSQTLRWLRWLAARLRQQAQTTFYLENLNQQWLPTRSQRVLSPVVAIAITGLISTMVLELAVLCALGRDAVASDWGLTLLLFTFGFSLSWTLPLGIIAAFMNLRPVEKLHITLVGFLSRLRKALSVGLISALVFAGLVTAAMGALLDYSSDIAVVPMKNGLIVGSVFALLVLLSGEGVETRRNPNQGTFRSMIVGLTIGLIIGSASGMILWWSGRDSEFMSRASVGLFSGVFYGLCAALICGGLFSIKHWGLRLVLWTNRSAPLRYVRFLDYATERLLLRKVGGGYIFTHRMLLEYFASLPEQTDSK